MWRYIYHYHYLLLHQLLVVPTFGLDLGVSKMLLIGILLVGMKIAMSMLDLGKDRSYF